MKQLNIKQVPLSLVFFVGLIWPLGVVLNEPVESNAPATNLDAEANRVIYDQRQTGKYNIHVSIKDVALIEMDQNGIEDVAYGDDDYYYDDGHLTVKPILLNPTTGHNQPNRTSITTDPSTQSTSEPPSTLKSPTTLTTTSSNQTYSPNLLADIAATHSTNYNSSPSFLISTVSGLKPTEVPKRGAQNVVILDTQSLTHNSPTSTHKPSVTTTTIFQIHETEARSKDIPNLSITQEAKEPKQQSMDSDKVPLPPFSRFADSTHMEKTETDQENTERKGDSKIYKFKVRRAHKQVPSIVKTSGGTVPYPYPFIRKIARRCRAHQYRDETGDCRTKRSSSFLKKLFRMLVTLPFPHDRADDNHDDE